MKHDLRVCAKITSDFGGSATGPDARLEGGSVSAAILDRPRNEADGPVPPRPAGLGGFGSLASLLLGHRPLRVCSLVAPRQRAKSPPAKPELIFAQTLRTGSPHPLGAAPRGAGTNFSLFSRDATQVDLVFFDRMDDARPSRIIALDPSTHRLYHYWHAFVPGVVAGQLCDRGLANDLYYVLDPDRACYLPTPART